MAGGNGRGNELNQLKDPCGIFIDDDQTIYIVDCWNHRILQWKCNATNGQIVAGGNEEGNKTNQLNYPTHVKKLIKIRLNIENQMKNRLKWHDFNCLLIN
jgi:hypothetical protein